jgi:Asp-tRNA(Asn)/Glu-tRNA(Gln) amidotransferase A subunit family amidase
VSATATAAAAAVRTGEISAVELAESTIVRIRERDGEINSFACLLEDQAHAAARAVDEAVGRGDDPGPLAGVPVSIKDVVWTQDAPATNGCLPYRDFRPGADAVLVARMRAAGAVIVGKTTNPELCFAGTTLNRVTGVTRNPWNLERTPGGSSGGAGASLAAGLTQLAVGSDGGGSIRIPAAFCGVAGHKPTHGLVPSTPGFRGWPTLSVKGPLARTVSDLATCMTVIAGPDPSDPATERRPPQDYAGAVAAADVSGLRVAVSADLGCAPLEPGVRAAFDAAVAALAAAGWSLEEAHPATDEPTPLWNSIAAPEGFASHRRLLAEHRDELEPRTVEILEAGDVPLGDYLDAMHERATFTAEWLGFFEHYDLLLTPAMGLVALDAEAYSPTHIGDYEVNPFWDDWATFCLPANLTGMPATSIPCGLSDGLPVGLQLMGRRFDDATVLGAAAAAEVVLPPLGVAPGY